MIVHVVLMPFHPYCCMQTSPIPALEYHNALRRICGRASISTGWDTKNCAFLIFHVRLMMADANM